MAIAVALISVFSLQGTVSNRVSDSNDELVASAYFNKDVQSAEQMTTSPSVSCGPTPAPTNPAQTQLLGLEWSANTAAPTGYDTVVSYVSVPVVNPQAATTTYKMLRQVCTFSSGSALTLTSTITVATDIGSAPALTITGAPPNNAATSRSFVRTEPSDEPVRLDVVTRGDGRHVSHHRTRIREQLHLHAHRTSRVSPPPRAPHRT